MIGKFYGDYSSFLPFLVYLSFTIIKDFSMSCYLFCYIALDIIIQVKKHLERGHGCGVPARPYSLFSMISLPVARYLPGVTPVALAKTRIK